jgi:AbrB family looped-hinge helix DNA binding protein
VAKVKRQRKRGYTRLSAKHQVTIPVDVLERAGLAEGDEVRVRALRAGQIVLEREDDVVARYAGALTGVYQPGELEELRDEWR